MLRASDTTRGVSSNFRNHGTAWFGPSTGALDYEPRVLPHRRCAQSVADLPRFQDPRRETPEHSSRDGDAHEEPECSLRHLEPNERDGRRKPVGEPRSTPPIHT